LLLNKFFPIVDTCLSCEDIARQVCAMVPRWRFLATFLRPLFSASRVQQVSDPHLKFALRPHHVWKYGRQPICGGEIRRGKEDRTRMWANAQPDCRPAEHKWRPLFNAAKFGCCPLLDDVQ